jgi:hypothetical protein
MSIAVQLPSHRERRNRLPGSACDLAQGMNAWVIVAIPTEIFGDDLNRPKKLRNVGTIPFTRSNAFNDLARGRISF